MTENGLFVVLSLKLFFLNVTHCQAFDPNLNIRDIITVTDEGHARAQDPGIAIMRIHKRRAIF
jgi:hypothetical protein